MKGSFVSTARHGTTTLGALTVTGTTTLAALTTTGTVTLNALAVSGTSTFSGAITASNAGNSIVGITVATNSDKTGYSLAAAGLDSVVVETGMNARQALSVTVSAAAGVLAGAATTTVTIAAAGVAATNRVTATVDSDGNRSAVTLNLPA